jgi:hypothetical protein
LFSGDDARMILKLADDSHMDTMVLIYKQEAQIIRLEKELSLERCHSQDKMDTFEKGIQEILSSKSYRIGRIITAPSRWIRKIMRTSD